MKLHFNKNKWKVGYSKKGTDLPLTSFAVDHNYPCLDLGSPFSYDDSDQGIGENTDFM